jgi:toxin ParE1/3/4
MRFIFGNRLKQVWPTAKQERLLRSAKYGSNSDCRRESPLDEFGSCALQAIHDYLAQTSRDYAVRIIDRLTKRSIQIATFPNSGRMVPEYERNEIREVIEGRYRIIYLVGPAQVQVLAAIHGARDLRP